MPPLAETRTDQAYRAMVDRLRTQVAVAMALTWDQELEAADLDASVARFAQAAAAIVIAGQANAQTLVAGYVAQYGSMQLGEALEPEPLADIAGTARSGAPIADALLPLSGLVKQAIGDGRELADALEFGRSLAARFGDNEVTAAADAELDNQAKSPKAVGWEGVVSPDACDACQANRGFHELGEDIYRHPSCNCDRRLVFAGEPTTPGEAAQEIVARVMPEEPDVTNMLTAIGEQTGGELEGLDFRIKSVSSTTSKIAQMLVERPGITLREAQASVFDALRYTYRFDEAGYTRGVAETLAHFRSSGLEVVRMRNYWGGQGYAGINLVMRTPGGQLFEMQFHTAVTLATKEPSHLLYEKLRILPLGSPERDALQAQVDALWGPIQANIPPGAAAITG